VRASDKEMESISVARSSLKLKASAPVLPESLGEWSSQDLQYARTPSRSQTGGSGLASSSFSKSRAGGNVYVSSPLKKSAKPTFPT